MIHPLLPTASIEILVDGATTEPQLNHPEGICADREGYLWCGGEQGEIYRINPTHKTFELVTTTNGFVLGCNFDPNGILYLCDSKHRGVFRYNPKNNELQLYTTGSKTLAMVFPNYPIVDAEGRYLYVSDSNIIHKPGPGIWRVDLQTGETILWCDHAFDFANGLAFSIDGTTLFVAESWGRCVKKIPILEDGTPGEVEVVLALPGTIPDGLAMSPKGMLYITTYEPSRIYRWDSQKHQPMIELVVQDPDAHLFCHPTNCVLVGNELYVSNLGRWHISKVNLESI